MKIDIDLIRRILISLEEDKPVDYLDQKTGFHCWLLADAGYIYGTNLHKVTDKVSKTAPLYMTWKGYSYLNRIRNINYLN